ncbi:hypothetical protein B0T10DRAFT_543099 [Thelonectria olida]|uniref:DUF7702 domain-containing protein n=1 Tax=Thelonectria olida TaxID=1576542 RepID=A0A9P8WFU5_9HYPO|nr:hypothetical protein B0T10DRAFT_543099 [Thelonectria olida]
MLNSHACAGIAQVVFYIPILPIAAFTLVRVWNHGLRRAIFPLVTFSLFRLSGGILTIILESDPRNIGLIIATTVLLNIGLVPLLLSAVGFIRLILKSSIDDNKRAHVLLKVIRIAFFAAITLLIISGALSGSEKNMQVSRSLSKAGYVLLAAVVVLMAAELAHLFTQRYRIAPGRFLFVRLTLATIPVLLLRTAYGLLCAFTVDNPSTIWNPLSGSAVAFTVMCLISEYITVLVFIFLGIRYWQLLQREGSKSPSIVPGVV